MDSISTSDVVPQTVQDEGMVSDLEAPLPDEGPSQSLIGPTCFSEIYDPGDPGPDYDQFAPIAANHCLGTNHQEIEGVEQVVFLGDSVTVGTPNLTHALSVDNGHFYRNLTAEWLANRFSLDKGSMWDWGLWKAYDYVSGQGSKQVSGDFKNCSKWGARTDDFLKGGNQLAACFPNGGSPKRTLVIFTMGGNDISSITDSGGTASAQDVAAGYPDEWAIAESAIQDLREGIAWLKDPERFPNGSYVIFANPFEFTDATGEVASCPAAGLTGMQAWADPSAQEDIVVWMLEQYMQISVEYQVDLIWLLEHFCGHGYKATGAAADPNNRCYRGPNTQLYFDETCIHPNDPGHAALFGMFKAVVEE
jgi:lysophospholipase L1-like esterase